MPEGVELPIVNLAATSVASSPTESSPSSTLPTGEATSSVSATASTSLVTDSPFISYVAIGTRFNYDEDCQIADPLPSPVIFPSGTTQLAFQVVFDVDLVRDWGYSIDLGEANTGAGLLGVNCDKYAVVRGAAVQVQAGVTMTRGDGQAFEPGNFTWEITVNGQVIEVPFEIE